MRARSLRVRLVIAAVALVVAAVPGREAVASAPQGPGVITAFTGMASGQLYEVVAFRPAGRFRGCVIEAMLLGGVGPGGCQHPAPAARELAQHATACGRHQAMIGGLVPAGVADVRAVVAGRTLPVRLRALPAGWTIHGSVWMLILRPAGSAVTLDAVDATGAVIGTDVVPAAATRCPPPTLSAHGRLAGRAGWRVAYSLPTGVGATPNVCGFTELGDHAGYDGVTDCRPTSELGRGRIVDRNRSTNDDPAATLFSGLVHRHAKRLRIMLDDGSTVTARILRFGPRVRTPFAVYVAAVPGHRRAVRFSLR